MPLLHWSLFLTCETLRPLTCGLWGVFWEGGRPRTPEVTATVLWQARAETVLGARLGAVVVAAGVEELDPAQEFAPADAPILGPALRAQPISSNAQAGR